MAAMIAYVVVVVLSLGAVGLNVLSLPGNWVMMVGIALLSWSSGWSRPSLLVMGGMVGVLLAGEVVELLGSVVGAKRFGASRSATWAAIGGAVVGALVGMPVAIVGNILGAIVGAFLAAWAVELMKRRGMKAATWAAVGAALGRTMGMAAKISCGLIVWVGLVILAWP